MHRTRNDQIMQRWNIVQYELISDLREEIGSLTPKLEKVIHTLEWVRIEEFVENSWAGIGRPPHERAWLANAFVAKVVLNIATTVGLIERLSVDRALRRICGFPLHKRLPSEATFSRVFEAFADSKLADRAHEALVVEQLGDRLMGHISRDGTAIEARERPCTTPPVQQQAPVSQTAPLFPDESKAEVTSRQVAAPPVKRAQRGRPRKGDVRLPAKESPIAVQRQQTLEQLLDAIPSACDRGTKCNSQGYHVSWNGYKLHIDTVDCGVPVAALLSSASMHDSLAAIPLSHLSAQRVTNLYDVMDAAYCSSALREHCRDLGHVPLIDHNPRRGEKKAFEPHEAIRYNERTVAERTNARLKDEFGGRTIRVQGATKVKSHLMFGVLVLSADQLMRLRH